MAEGNRFEPLITALCKYTQISIIIKGSPDPDALAGSLALSLLAEELGIPAKIYTEAPLSLRQNKIMVKKLKIALHPLTAHPQEIAAGHGYCVVDHQDSSVPSLPKEMPCIVHIDHHKKIDPQPEALFRIVGENAGACSTIFTELLFGGHTVLKKSAQKRLAGALVLGILTDTDNLEHGGAADRRAVEILTQFAGSKAVASIRDLGGADDAKEWLALAEDKARQHGTWLLSGIGFIPAAHRDNIALAADALLARHPEYATVVVYAAIEDQKRHTITLDASLRTRKEKCDLDRIIKKITPQGGARRYKGAFQSPLDFFRFCPDRKLLWELIEESTENALTQARASFGRSTLLPRLKRSSKAIRSLFRLK